MKKDKERSLAYALAKTIPFNDLDSVSGGRGSGSVWSHHPTLGFSGNRPRDADVSIDFSIEA